MQFEVLNETNSAIPLIFAGAITVFVTLISNFFQWLIKKLTWNTFKLVITYGIIYVSWGIYASVIGFAVALVIQFSNIIMDFLNLFESLPTTGGGGSCLAQNISAGLSASGLLSGFNSSMPVINSALSFFILSVFYIFLSKLRRIFQDSAIKLIEQLGK